MRARAVNRAGAASIGLPIRRYRLASTWTAFACRLLEAFVLPADIMVDSR